MNFSERAHDETGSALIVALILVAVWSVAIMAILGFVATGFGVAQGSDDERDLVYAADAGAESAISHLVHGGSLASCPGFQYETSVSVHVADVTCVDVTPDSEEPGPVVVDLTVSVDGSNRLSVRVELDLPPEPDPDDPEPPPPGPVAVTITRWNAFKA